MSLTEFLAAELRPTPGRLRAALRFTVTSVSTAAVAMTLHLPHASYALISIAIVSVTEAGASLRKGLQRLVGTFAGATLGVLGAVACTDRPWLLVPLVGTIAGSALFFQRTTTAPYAAYLGGLTALIVMVGGGPEPSSVLSTGVWRAIMVTLGVALGVGGQVLLWPDDPLEQLRDQLRLRLETVEALLRDLVGTQQTSVPADGLMNPVSDDHGERERPPLTHVAESMVLSGLTAQLDLLASSEARHPSQRSQHSAQLALIAGIEQLLTAAAQVERLLRPWDRRPDDRFPHAEPGATPTNRQLAGAEAASPVGEIRLTGPLRERLLALADGCGTVRESIGTGRPVPAAAETDSERDTVTTGGGVVLPSIVEMERVLKQLAGAASADAVAGELKSHLDTGDRAGFFTPACSLANGTDLAAAFRAGIAATICFIVVNGLGWPALDTSIWTCLIVAQATLGASLQKTYLRLAGATLGGLMGILVIIYAMPNMDSLAPFLVVIAACTFLAGWVTVGSPRVSYAGVQISLAFALCTLNQIAPTSNLEPARNRVLGISLGILVSTVVDFWFQPVHARTAMWRALAASLRALAGLSRVGLARAVAEPIPVRGFRWQVYQNLAKALRLSDEAGFEPGARTAEAKAERAALARLAGDVQAAFLAVLAVTRHRLDVDLGAARARVFSQFAPLADAIAAHLDALADRIDRVTAAVPPALEPLVTNAAAALANLEGDAGIAPSNLVQTNARLALYRELAAEVRRLESEVSAALPTEFDSRLGH